MKKAIITVVGKDAVGIFAKTCTYLSKDVAAEFGELGLKMGMKIPILIHSFKN